jgi:Fe-S cluster biosynthesis and repair protein YggX
MVNIFYNLRNFILKIENLIKNNINDKKIIKEIYNEYFFDDNNKTKDILNFDKSYYEDIQKLYKVVQDNPKIFEKSLNKVKSDIQIDSYPQFLSSKIFEKIKKENKDCLVSVKFNNRFFEKDFCNTVIEKKIFGIYG